MSENTVTANAAATPAEAEKPQMSAEDKAKAFAALPDTFQQAVTEINSAITEHNGNVEAITKAEAKDPKLIKAEVFETTDNVKVAKLYKEYLKLIQQADALKDKAYELIDAENLMPAELSEAEVTKLKTEVSENHKVLKDQVKSLATMAEMMKAFITGDVMIHVEDIKTRRGTSTGTTTAATGDGPKRPRFKRIEVNGVIEDDKGNKVYALDKDSEPKFNLGLVSTYLRKHHKGISWTTNELQEAYYSGQDQNNMPEEHAFTMNYTYKDGNGNEHTIPFVIKTYR